MKIIVNWKLCTDGDFSLRNREKYGCVSYDGHEEYAGAKEFCENDSFQCIMKARHFLEEMLCDMHVSPSHYYLILDIYHMFEEMILFVGAGNLGLKSEYMCGNYEGTEIAAIVFDPNQKGEPAGKAWGARENGGWEEWRD